MSVTRPAETALSLALWGLLLVAGPFLLLPDILPPAVRVPIVLSAAIVACVLSIPAMPDPLRRGLLAAFILCFWVGWWRASSPPAFRHGAGLALGLLTMSTVIVWGRTTGRLLAGAGAFLILGGAALTLGIAGIESHPPKFLPIWTAWLPQIKFGLAGLDARGFVNPNALAGTAACIAPLALALLLQSGGPSRTLRVTLRGIAAVTTAAVLVAIVLAQSRSALLAVLVMILVVTCGLSRWRKVGVTVCAVLLLGGLVAYWWPISADERIVRAQSVERSASHRMYIWREGFRLFAEAPLFGIGLNEFRAVAEPAPGPVREPIAHAHNVFLQVALDTGALGLLAYTGFMTSVLAAAVRTSRRTRGPAARIAIGGALSLVGVHVFGLADTIALGAKVGVLQWFAAGLVLAASRLDPPLAAVPVTAAEDVPSPLTGAANATA